MRVALVTGAARGIGAAVVAALCDRGYRVAAVDACQADQPPPGVAYPLATPADLADVAAAYPDQVLPLQADVRDPQALGAAVAATLAHFGRLDAVVAAAGVVAGGQPVWSMPEEELRTLLEVNVLGVWNTAAATIPHLLASEDPSGCRFVAIASAGAERGLFHLGGYTMSKQAVVGIVRALAADLVGTGVTAVAVSPGATRTPVLEASAEIYGVSPEHFARHHALRRLLEPEEIAATIALCCSPEGAALNGSVIHAGGGFQG